MKKPVCETHTNNTIDLNMILANENKILDQLRAELGQIVYTHMIAISLDFDAKIKTARNILLNKCL